MTGHQGMSGRLYPVFVFGIVLFDNARGISHRNRIGRDILGDNGPSSHDGVPADGNARGDNGIGADPAFIFNNKGRDAYPLFMKRLLNILLIMVQAAGYDMLRQDHIIADGNRTDNDISQADQRIGADTYSPHTIIDCTEILDHRIVADRKRIERQHVHPYPAADDDIFALFMKETVYKHPDPKPWTSLIGWYQHPMDKFFQARTVPDLVG